MRHSLIGLTARFAIHSLVPNSTLSLPIRPTGWLIRGQGFRTVPRSPLFPPLSLASAPPLAMARADKAFRRDMNAVGRPWGKKAKNPAGKAKPALGKAKAPKAAGNFRDPSKEIRVVSDKLVDKESEASEEFGFISLDFGFDEPPKSKKTKPTEKSGRYFDIDPVDSTPTNHNHVSKKRKWETSDRADDQSAGAPWLPSDLILPPSPSTALDIELPLFASYQSLTDEENAIRTSALELLRQAVSKKPGWTVHPGGSWAAGTGTFDSDLDVVILYKPPEDEEGWSSASDSDSNSLPNARSAPTKSFQNKHLASLRKHLPPSLLIPKARVPVLKLSIDGLEVDVTCGHPGLPRAANLVSSLLATRQQLMPLILLVKRILKDSGLNEPYEGGLGGFPCVLLVLWWHAWTRSEASIGQLTLDFLRDVSGCPRFAEVMATRALVLSTGGVASTVPGLRQKFPRFLDVRDPLDPQNNAARAFRKLPLFRRVCGEVYRTLVSEAPGSRVGRVVETSRGSPVTRKEAVDERPRKRKRDSGPEAFIPKRGKGRGRDADWIRGSVRIHDDVWDETDLDLHKRTGWRGEATEYEGIIRVNSRSKAGGKKGGFKGGKFRGGKAGFVGKKKAGVRY